MRSNSDHWRYFARKASYPLDSLWLKQWNIDLASTPGLGTFRRDVSVPSDYRCSQHLCAPWKTSSEAAWVGGLVLLWPVVGQGGLL